MNIALDSFCQPERRPATALGGLLATLIDPMKRPEIPGRQRYWSNRPGQDHAETFILASLIALTSFGLAVGLLIQGFAPTHIGDWLAVALLTAPAFFAIIHLLIFAAAGMETIVHLLGIRPDLPPGHFCGRLFLLLLTLTSAALFARADSGLLLRAVTGFWLAIAGLNFFAWILLRMRDLRSALATSSHSGSEN